MVSGRSLKCNAIFAVCDLSGALVSISQTALSLFTYTYMKFLSFLTQRLSFCSTNVVKVHVSSILMGKKIFEYGAGIDPRVLNQKSLALTTRPPRIRWREWE